jgi:hypothetical protein
MSQWHHRWTSYRYDQYPHPPTRYDYKHALLGDIANHSTTTKQNHEPENQPKSQSLNLAPNLVPSQAISLNHEVENQPKPQSLNLATHLVPSQTISLQTTPDSTTTKQTKEAENQTNPLGLNYSLNQVRLCTTRLDDGITNME